MQYKGNTAELIAISKFVRVQPGEAPDSILLQSTGKRINSLRQKFLAVDYQPGAPHFLDFGVRYAITGNVTAPQDENGVLLFTAFAEYLIEQKPHLTDSIPAIFKTQIIHELVEFFQVARDCHNIVNMDFGALHGGGGGVALHGGGTASPGSHQPTGQSSGGGQPPASPVIQEVAALLAQQQVANNQSQLQMFGTLLEGSEQRVLQSQQNSEQRLLQSQQNMADLILNYSKQYTDQRFNEMRDYVDKKVAAEHNLSREESETLKAALMALELELANGAKNSNHTEKAFTLPGGQMGYFADGKLKLPLNLPTPARNTPGGRYDVSSQREVGECFVLTNGQRTFYENGRLCIAPLPPDLKPFDNSPMRSSNNMAGLPADESKCSPKRSRKSLGSHLTTSSKKARKSEGASSLAAQQSEVGEPEAVDSPEFYDANDSLN